MIKKILLTIFIGFSISILYPINSTKVASSIQPNPNDKPYKVVEGSSLLIKLPRDISKKEFAEFNTPQMSKERSEQIADQMTELMENSMKEANLTVPYLTVAVVDENDNLLFPSEKPKKTGFKFFEFISKAKAATGPSSQNRIEFVFPTVATTDFRGDCTYTTTNCIPWTDEEAAVLQEAVNQGLPIMQEIFGPPFLSKTDPTKTSERWVVQHVPNITSAGITNNAPFRLIKLRDPKPSGPLPQLTAPHKNAFWHEWNHAAYFDNSFAINFQNWSEPIAQLTSYIITKKTGYYLNHLPIEISDYEQYNKPFFDSKTMASPTLYPVDYQARYTTSPEIWLKMYNEHPNVLKDFNAQIYDLWNVSPSTFQPTREGLLFLKNAFEQDSHTTIEGEELMNWFSKQYPIMKTAGDVKFGVKLLADFNNIKVSFNYTKSTDSSDNPHTDTGINNGILDYKVYYNGALLYEPPPISINDWLDLDITDDVKTYFNNTIPQGKLCVAARINSDPTERSSCYYLRGFLTNPNQLGIVGTIGGPTDINATGTVTIKPLYTSSIPSSTVSLSDGGFVAPGPSNQYFLNGGAFQLDYVSSDGNKKVTKYITKEENSYYYTNISSEDNLPSLTSLSSNVISSGSSTIYSSTNKDAATSYIITQNGKKWLTSKSWEATHIRNQFLSNLTSADTYSLYLSDNNGIGMEGPELNFGQTIEMYFSKWANKAEIILGEPLTYKLKVSNLTTATKNYDLADLIEPGLSDPYDISDNGVFANNKITWPQANLGPQESKTYFFSRR